LVFANISRGNVYERIKSRTGINRHDSAASCSRRHFPGIVGDGATLNTAAIQLAIDSLTSHGGGVLEFRAGRYVTGTIQLKDNVRLRLVPDAILLGSHNPADYRILEPFLTGDGGIWVMRW